MNGLHGPDAPTLVNVRHHQHNKERHRSASIDGGVSPTDLAPLRQKRSAENGYTKPSPPTSSKGVNGGAASPSNSPHTLSRRPSWLTNISSKFSSAPAVSEHVDHPESPSPSVASTATTATSNANSTADSKHAATQPGFLLSTLRKLSVTGAGARDAFGRRHSLPAVGPSERIVLNRDANRERCRISELDANKLRKVAFCVDVEVAPSPEDVEARKEARRKRREAKEKEKEREKERLKQLQEDGTPASESQTNAEVKPNSIQTQDESKSKEATGEQPLSAVPGAAESASDGRTSPEKEDEQKPAATGEEKPKSRRKVHARPTTDPVKIYTQCCQLRETHMLPEVKEQLIKANGASVLQELDLTGHKIQIADAVALSDFLALVPIKKLVLDDCDLTDEMVRVILSALSAVKSPNYVPPPSKNDGDRSPGAAPKTAANEKHHERGVVEKISFKGNGRIGADGWNYISCFIHMSHSLRAIDLSKVTFPRPVPSLLASLHHHGKTLNSSKCNADPTCVFARSLGERIVGHGLEELIMGHCQLNAEQLKAVMEGVGKGGTKRLGLEGNSITDDGLALIGRWIKGSASNPGVCEGLDLSGNDIHEHLDILSASINEISSLRALDLSNCKLTPTSLSSLLPALAQVQEFRWLDLSNNPLLFSSQPDSLGILRRFLPRMKGLRKLGLSNTSMTPDHCIALSEILPEMPCLAYFSISNNHLLPSGESKTDQEEGAALYAALTVAVEVSKSIVRVDIDEPGPDSGHVLQNLSKRLVAYCLKNIESGAAYGDYDLHLDGVSPIVPPSIPHNTSNLSASSQPLDDDYDDYQYDDRGVWRDEETYVVGGTGVVKALGVCLGNKPFTSSSTTAPFPPLKRESTLDGFDSEPGSERANEMSKALLTRARIIKEKIQPALRKAHSGEIEELHHRRLLFLDATLYRVIHRFEEEYPECKLPPPPSPPPPPERSPPLPPTAVDIVDVSKPISRRASEVSLHGKYLQNEEAQMHKLRVDVDDEMEGEEVRRRVLGEEWIEDDDVGGVLIAHAS